MVGLRRGSHGQERGKGGLYENLGVVLCTCHSGNAYRILHVLQDLTKSGGRQGCFILLRDLWAPLFKECALLSVLMTGVLEAALEDLAAKSIVKNHSSNNLYNIIVYFQGSSCKHLLHESFLWSWYCRMT